MGKISQFLVAVKAGLVSDIPPAYQACESCRETTCNSQRVKNCKERILGELQESNRRKDDDVK
jgi:hypothetical protein